MVQAVSWTIGMHDEPQYSYCRKGITKVLYLFSVIDDIYDSYATLDEAKLFTDVLDRFIIIISYSTYWRKIYFEILNHLKYMGLYRLNFGDY